ncbi:Single-stranded DNA-binding protein, mitochondrial [Apostasia shenzhenica]|uniref:Single-stranded DNA-binding protein, mitochondrial n=1 Tax=Apostasia shenzhenica TaxID=1088818 RepID=A0A2I0B1N3_9ASPA|nr:Single-stranded DNA-binding protein, mitochondrial [Apostasia shenzhenica]
MALAAISRSLLRRPNRCSFLPSVRFSTSSLAGDESELENDGPVAKFSESSSADAGIQQGRLPFNRPLENGLDPGVYKAILVGKVGQKPVHKQLKSGRGVVLFSLGTGGIRNNRRPLDDEEPREYAERCAVQWHRVCVYQQKLGNLALSHVKPGSILYLEGNLETKVFSDPVTGLVRRIREIAIRFDGRLLFLDNGSESGEPESAQIRSVGYY